MDHYSLSEEVEYRLGEDYSVWQSGTILRLAENYAFISGLPSPFGPALLRKNLVRFFFHRFLNYCSSIDANCPRLCVAAW
jgi:hypothetical protein